MHFGEMKTEQIWNIPYVFCIYFLKAFHFRKIATVRQFRLVQLFGTKKVKVH